MCCIIYIPKGIDTPGGDFLYKIYEYNKDGIGCVLSDNNFIKTSRFTVFLEWIKRNRKNQEDCIIHFRNATRGDRSYSNVQPFYNKETNLWFAHNGTINHIHANETEGDSDSKILFEALIVPLVKHCDWDNPVMWEIIEEQIEKGRGIFMKDGTVKMIAGDPNYKDWILKDGVYYSRKYEGLI